MSRLQVYEQLRDDILSCQRCDLGSCGPVDGQDPHVVGQGSIDADIMFVAEAPGEQETIYRRPLTAEGKSGKLYERTLDFLELTRDQVFTTNVVACRPPDNRDPENWEVSRCRPLFERQLELVNPKLVVTFGRFAAQTFLNNIKITKDHGIIKRSEKYSVDVFPLCHPAYLQAYAPYKQRQGFKKDLKVLRSIIKKGF